MSAHDPRRVVEDLRDHLAAHDRRLAFLLGAGTSSAVNVAPPPTPGAKPEHKPIIPGVLDLTTICATAVSKIGTPYSAAWESMIKQCEKGGRKANVENVLSQVRLKMDAIGEGETLVGLNRLQLIEVEKTICSTIADVVSPADSIISQRMPHHDFADWAKKVSRTAPLEIFTTNYDVLLERALEASGVPVFDGFVGTLHPFFYPECLEDEDLLPKPKWIRLWKLHGSVNWLLEAVESVGATRKRIIRGQPTKSGELILPSHRKYDESRKQPYMAYMDRLLRILSVEHALLITCGYSFGDEHINAILYGALDNRNTANIISLQFGDLKETDGLVKAAMHRPNLTVIGPNGAVISGIWGTWQLTEPVDAKTSSFMDAAFDSNALPEDEGSPATASADLKGTMRLGDFNWLCQFLKAMGPGIQ